jgi:dTDP-4-dehydrorhamnose 3,5-epimerase
MPFKFSRTKIPEVLVIEPHVFSDSRGFFVELIKAVDFKEHGIACDFAQISQSSSQKNVVRGLHYQLNPKAQTRLVSVVRGEIFDVAVDIRRGSPTFGQWVSEHLCEGSKKMLFIPEGFAHGFCVLSAQADVFYYCSREYAPQLERNILWNDPAIGITWPIIGPSLSPKDSKAPLLSAAENNFAFLEKI